MRGETGSLGHLLCLLWRCKWGAEGTGTLDSVQEPHQLGGRTTSVRGGSFRLAPLPTTQWNPLPTLTCPPKAGRDGRVASGSLCCGGSRRWSSVRSGKRSAHITSHLAQPPLVGTMPLCRPANSLQNLCQRRRGCQGGQHPSGVTHPQEAP